MLALLLCLSLPASGQQVTTVVGTGVASYSGDGGPATSATLNEPQGISFDGAGNLYIADAVNCRVRKVDAVTGIITTVAGTGIQGFSGDGGPATQARLGSTVAIFADQAGNLLITDQLNNRIRRVDVTTGIITTVAGNGLLGYAGDGGPATSARISQPQGVCADLDGNIYIADTINFRIRKVFAGSGIITTIAGTGFPSSNGDGGSALSATITSPRRVTVDPANNIYILDRASNPRVRRIDGATGIITRVAGGSTAVADSGEAITMNLGSITDVQMDGGCNLIVISAFRTWRVARGVAKAIAGTGAQGYGGDGGDPRQAVFNNISGAAVNATGEVFLTDRSNQRIRKISLSGSELANLTVTAGTLQSVLDGLRRISGSLAMSGAAERTTLIAGVLQTIGLDFIVTDNGDLVFLDTPELSSVCGSVRVENNVSLNVLSMPSLTIIDGNFGLFHNLNTTGIAVSSLSSVRGNVNVVGNINTTQIGMSSLSSVGGSITVSNNPSATEIDLGNVADVGGGIVIDNNGSATEIDLGNVVDVGGGIVIDDNGSATEIDLGNVTDVPGGVSISGNTSATSVDLGAMEGADGDVTITDNGTAAVHLDSLIAVGGSLTVETQAQDTLDVSGAVAAEDLTLTGEDAEIILATTAEGTSTVTFLNEEATMSAQLPEGAFGAPVAFTVEHIPPESLVVEDGSTDITYTIDPIAAYVFSFAVPTLNESAVITFEIHLDALDMETRDGLLAALAQGRARLAVKGDELGSVYQPLTLCQGSQTPETDGCVDISYPDTNTVVFTGSADHFSTWAVAILSSLPGGDAGPPPNLPGRLGLELVQNPVHRSAPIQFTLPEAGGVTLDLFDAGGRRVRSLMNGEIWPAGRHEMSWNGTDDRGRAVQSGIYFLRLESRGRAETRRLVFLR